MPFGKAKDLSPIDQLTHFEKDPNFFIVFPARRRTNHGLTYTKNFSGGAAPQTPRFVRPSASGVRHVEFLRDLENFESSLSFVEFLR